MEAASDVALDRLGRLQPAAVAALTQATDAAWAAVEPSLLAACHERVVELLTGRPTATAAAPGDPTVQACLDLTEQFVVSVDAIDDDDVQPVLDALGPAGTWAFLRALYVIEMRERMLLVAGAVLEGDR